MSTRTERKRRRLRLCCRHCGEYRAHHLDPWTRTYICAPKGDA